MEAMRWGFISRALGSMIERACALNKNAKNLSAKGITNEPARPPTTVVGSGAVTTIELSAVTVML
jgi:hypothetical protein